MEVELKYGMGFSGTTYYLLIDNESFNLLGNTLGVSSDLARKKAKQILIEKCIDIDISKMPFKWDGCM